MHEFPEVPAVGFKLHISAAEPDACAVFDRVIPTLLREAICFKVVRSMQTLRRLNAGDEGLTQVGKFLVLYPRSANHAVELAARLHEITRGVRGPRIVSDRRYRPGSAVWYRYGMFTGGDNDTRLPGDAVPQGVADPFNESDTQRETSLRSLADRFVIVQQLQRRGKGIVYRAIELGDRSAPRRCIVKQAHVAGEMDEHGTDAIALLAWERCVLEHLGGAGGAPRVLDDFSYGDDSVLVLEDLGDATLADWGKRHMLTPSDLRELARSLCRQLTEVHAHGVIIRDLSPTNVVIDSAMEPRLVDFEHSWCRAMPRPPLTRVLTAGYSHEEHRPGTARPLKPAPSHDLFAVGRIIDALLQSDRPDAVNPNDRSIEAVLCAVATRAAATDHRRRYRSARRMLSSL